jgi:hypothetical protein
MDVDKPQGGHSTAHEKSVPIGPGGGMVTQHVIAITPINPKPKTLRGKEIVNEIRATSPRLLATSMGISSMKTTASSLLAAAATAKLDEFTPGAGLIAAKAERSLEQRPAASLAGRLPDTSALGRSSSPIGGDRVDRPPCRATLGRSLGAAQADRVVHSLLLGVTDVAGPMGGKVLPPMGSHGDRPVSLPVGPARLETVVDADSSSLGSAAVASPLIDADVLAEGPTFTTPPCSSPGRDRSAPSIDKASPPPCALAYEAPARRSALHSVAADGSVATDEDTLQRAMRRKAAKNLDFNGMVSSSSSFISLSHLFNLPS